MQTLSVTIQMRATEQYFPITNIAVLDPDLGIREGGGVGGGQP